MGETASLEQRVRDILPAAGCPELADDGRGAGWRIVSPGWHVFTYQGAVRVDWWSDATLDPDPAVWQQDLENLVPLRHVLETAGLAVATPDASVLEIRAAPDDRAETRDAGPATGGR